MATPLQTATDHGRSHGPARIRYNHDAMIDIILAEPEISQKELAQRFGYTQTWISRVFCSEGFAHRLAERKTELVDPTIVASIEDRLKGLAMQATDVLADKLALPGAPSDLALKALEISTKALGFGARNASAVQINNSFVVALPPKIQSAAEWAATHGHQPRTINATAEEA